MVAERLSLHVKEKSVCGLVVVTKSNSISHIALAHHHIGAADGEFPV